MVFKFHPLSNAEINEYMRGYQYFKGCFMHDQVAKQKPLTPWQSMIINLDSSLNQGTHWVCAIYRNVANNPQVIYYDSFGLPPSDVIAAYLKKSKVSLLYNNGQIQNIASVACGYYCIDFLQSCYQFKDPIDILYQYDQTGKLNNEDILKSKFSRIKY